MNQNFIEDELIILTKQTIDKFLKENNSADLISLYIFYYYTAKWQETNQPYCTDGYIQKGLKWGYNKFKKAKDKLTEFKLIEQVIQRKDGKIDKYYIKLNYIFKKENTPVHLDPSTRKESRNALSDININKDISKDIDSDSKKSQTPKEKIKDSMKENSKQKHPNLLRYEDAKNITKYCLDELFKLLKILHPKIHYDKFYSSEEIYKCQRLIKYFYGGFPKTKYAKLRNWADTSIFCYVDNGMGKEEFKQTFNKVINLYKYEYKPEDKKNLPNRLSQLLYNPFSDCKSYFLAYKTSRIIKVEELKNDRHLDITQKYIDSFLKEELDIKEKNQLIKFIKNIVLEYDDIVNQKIKYKNKTYKRIDFESDQFIIHIGNLDNFINNHIDFLNTITKDSKIVVGVNLLKVNSYWWKQFQLYYSNTFNINFYEDEKELIKKVKFFVEKTT